MELTIKENTLFSKAKEAKTWLSGGSAPYMCARHCGFKTVAAMNDAISRMEIYEAEAAKQEQMKAEHEAPETVQALAKNDQTQPKMIKDPPSMQEQQQRPNVLTAADHVLRTPNFLIEHQKAQNGYPERIKINIVGKPGFISIRRDDLLKLANLLNTMADLIEESEI